MIPPRTLAGFLVAGLSLFFCACGATADKTPEPGEALPLSIDSVSTHRVGENLVRIIQHNMELLPALEVDLLSTPNVKRLDHLIVDVITVNGEKLFFSKAEGVFIEEVSKTKSGMEFVLEYYFPEKDGGDSVRIKCVIKVKDQKLSIPSCN